MYNLVESSPSLKKTHVILANEFKEWYSVGSSDILLCLFDFIYWTMFEREIYF